MKLEINLNDTVEVVLTEEGAKIYNNWWNDPKYHWREETTLQAGHVLRRQLWSLFQVFGPHIHLGGNAPFEVCKIVIDKGIS